MLLQAEAHAFERRGLVELPRVRHLDGPRLDRINQIALVLSIDIAARGKLRVRLLVVKQRSVARILSSSAAADGEGPGSLPRPMARERSSSANGSARRSPMAACAIQKVLGCPQISHGWLSRAGSEGDLTTCVEKVAPRGTTHEAPDAAPPRPIMPAMPRPPMARDVRACCCWAPAHWRLHQDLAEGWRTVSSILRITHAASHAANSELALFRAGSQISFSNGLNPFVIAIHTVPQPVLVEVLLP